ncbi:transglycosylase domain-containing protein [Nocardia sp. NPDC050406]|uniref:transglycosylase domain-containing protein n=1 Tax=Nocardia sp. NPDC050406 TaxID=3364318 RepID=UPI003795C6A6
MLVSSSRKRPQQEPPPYASMAGWNEQALRGQAAHRGAKPRRRAKPAKEARPRRPRTRAQRVRRVLVSFFLIFVAVPAMVLGLAYWSAEIPDPTSVQTNQIATILAADGTSVIAKVVPPEGNRIPVPLSEVPEPVRMAMLSAEDRDFYTNPGYSLAAFLRAARDNLTGREDAGGGSTITQQYVKNAFLSSERTMNRKMRELIISAKMAREWSKDDILAAYLNTIYYGRGAYGIASAAKSYFGKAVPELTLGEGAVLAALVRTPSVLDPETHLDELKYRWAYVLDGMVEMGALSRTERATVAFPPIVPVTDIVDDNSARGPEGLVRAQVLRELRASGISEHELNTGALQIITTIDARAQQAALDSVGNVLGRQPGELRTAVVSIDPRSGAVRAYYGGADGIGFDFAQAPLQTGSAFKTFAVIAALQQGIGLDYKLESTPVTVNGEKVTNVNDESCGTCSLAEAFKRSLNTSFYRLSQALFGGPKSIADAAHQAGIPTEIPGVPGKTLTEDGGPPLPSIVLGAYSVRPIDMASAYATIAAHGSYRQPYFVQKVITGDGRVLLDRENGAGQPQQRFSAAVADTTASAMLPIAGYSNGHALAGGRPSAAKTGTTQLGDTGQNKDAWMVGFTPSLSTAVWVGTEQSQPIRTRGGAAVYGSGLPADIWKQTMDGALEGTPVEQFPNPEPVGGTTPQGGFDILNPQPGSQEEPVVIIPPDPQPRQVEIFPGLSIPVPG